MRKGTGVDAPWCIYIIYKVSPHLLTPDPCSKLNPFNSNFKKERYLLTIRYSRYILYGMPQVTVYVRKEDEELWRKLPNKSEAVSKMLRGEKFKAIKIVEPLEKNASGAAPKMTISSSDVPMAVDNPHQLKEVLRDDYTLCKHGMDPQFCKHAKPGQKCK